MLAASFFYDSHLAVTVAVASILDILLTQLVNPFYNLSSGLVEFSFFFIYIVAVALAASLPVVGLLLARLGRRGGGVAAALRALGAWVVLALPCAVLYGLLPLRQGAVAGMVVLVVMVAGAILAPALAKSIAQFTSIPDSVMPYTPYIGMAIMAIGVIWFWMLAPLLYFTRPSNRD